MFERSGGLWLFGWGVVYFIAGMLNIFVFKEKDWFPWIQVGWLFIITLPLFCNPLARWLNMKETHMFNFFKKKDYSNVVKFPEPKVVPDNPYMPPEPEEKPANTFYRLGMTDNNRISLQMGHREITMNYDGATNLIEQLTVFRNQLQLEKQND
jgi:hypothetical protein